MQKSQQEIVYTKQPYVEDVGPRRIKSMQFTMMSGEEIMKAAECQVHLGSYYDATRKAIPGGLLDPRLGPATKNSSACHTCGAEFHECPGHFGYLNLVLPVFNVGYMSTILDVLKCICKSCSHILYDEALCKTDLKRIRNPKLEHLRRSELVRKIVKKCSTMTSNKAVKCKRCGEMNGMVKKAGSALTLIHDRAKLDNFLEECRSAISHTKESKAPISLATYILTPVKVLSIFRKISEENCEVLGLFDRPEKLIITNIAVPPISIRPSVFTDGLQSNENDITERLKQIIQANASLRMELLEGRMSMNKYLDSWDGLQAAVALYINSDVRVPNNVEVGKPLSGFVQRLKGKQGRFRGNLSGKRVEFTGRTVISPDPNLKITEVAIPIHMARILSFPERVSHHNIEKLRQLVSNGPQKYPGASMVRYPDGSSKRLIGSYRKTIAEELTFGCIVDRHLEDGDVVLFNRQPSLHRMSIMCHRARIMPWRTLRFNESVCNPYNADFDGDEMNMHVPQTEEARTEALLLMGVQNNLCTPKNGEILVASTQDFLTSAFLITRKDTFYDRAAFSLMCSYINDGADVVDLPTPVILKPIELWTGKQLFSVLLRPSANVRVYLNLTVKEKIYSKPKKGDKRERETMCPNDGFVYIRNSELISGQLGKATLGNGNKDGLYSVLLRDYNTHAASTCMNRLAKLSARWIGNHGFSIGIDDVQPGKKLIEEKAKTISTGYQECDRLIEEYNKGKLMLKPGCDATQTLETEITDRLNKLREEAGDVCMKELHWRNSPLIMSQCGSKGSVINISQMVACVGQQSVGGRRAPDGFIDRSLPHFTRKSKTPGAKGFVANSFYSGLRATEFFFHTMGGREGLVDTAVKTADTGYMSRRLIKGLEDLSIQYDNTVRNASGCIVQFLYGDDGLDPALMEGKGGVPLNLDRLFAKAKATCPAGEDNYLSPSDIPDVVENLFVKIDLALGGVCSEAFKKSLTTFLGGHVKRLESMMKLVDGDEDQCSETVEKLAHKVCGVSKRQIEVFLRTCINRFLWKKVEPGTAIGAIGAQSIGEPGTQMTLKTFHFAGVASMNITQGVPRIKEIINGAKKISTPIITAELEKNTNVTAARIVRSRIQKTVLGQVAKSIKIVMTSRSASVVITLDMRTIEEAQLSLDANIVKEAILKTPRIKLKPQHIKVMDNRKLEVIPLGDREKVHFELHSLKNMLPSIIVQGIKTVERAVIAQKKREGEASNQELPTYNMLVEGMGLDLVMGTEGVDGRKTTSNHVMEIQKYLGIEAARKCIIYEINQTMEHHGMSIDIRHMMLLADLMTFKGEVLGITRFGIQRMDKSVLMLASFEKTTDHLYHAAVHGRDDKIEGVSECIIMGIPMQLGTGILKVQQRIDPPPMLKYGSDSIIS
ncbi:DNA-directed RNA polymerase III subunit 1 [Mercurialis annua]|uniref:DNA-directed RNA polymerase III subunit 1 n=1 Tax=Mercurialis annua TaxID=3986 RepID=UPI00215F8A8E|nr:DNA-directed RNA polymerase III subunit 1 [Mercurialis annua]XP_050232321.1 DNA-directed RNA polymerase III subunit 1 [Mercurialis annua]XP_050232329.1 DNA-directed RNA polymerase III subunit 1 [Mercurialis annua]